MPDICMCVGTNCLIRSKCYRYLAKPSSYQSYSDFGLNLPVGQKIDCDHACQHFWDNNLVMRNKDYE